MHPQPPSSCLPRGVLRDHHHRKYHVALKARTSDFFRSRPSPRCLVVAPCRCRRLRVVALAVPPPSPCHFLLAYLRRTYKVGLLRHLSFFLFGSLTKAMGPHEFFVSLSSCTLLCTLLCAVLLSCHIYPFTRVVGKYDKADVPRAAIDRSLATCSQWHKIRYVKR
jgi:hypothetical protein